VLLAGAGRWGQVHARKLAARGDAVLAAIWDRDRGRAEALAADLGGAAVLEREGALPDNLDAAVVAVSSEAHVAVAEALLRRGVPVLLEKPLACDEAQLERLLEAADEAPLVPAMIERFNPAFVAAAGEAAGEDRHPLFLQAERLAPPLPAPPAGDPTDVILDLMIHDLDLVHALVPGAVTEVRAVGAPVIGPHCDMAHVRLAFEGGEVAVLTASRVSPRPTRALRLFGRRGYWSVDLLERQAHRCLRDGGLQMAGLEVEAGDALERQHTAFLARVREGGGDAGLPRAAAAHRVAFQVARAIEGGLARWLGS